MSSTPKPRGRPRTADPLAHTLRVRVSAAQRLALTRVATPTAGGLSGILRDAVVEYVNGLERPPSWRFFRK